MLEAGIPKPFPSISDRGKAIGIAAAAMPILLGSCGLLGWVLGNRYLTSIQPDLVAINPLTAVCMILAGLAMLSLHQGIASGRLASGIAAAIMVAGVIRLLGFYTPWDIPLDRILFRDRLRDVPFGPNHMAPNTAFAFLLLGGSLLAASLRPARARSLSQGMGMVLAAYAFFGLLGYLFHFVSLYRVAAHIPMAVPTILGFLFASIGILCLHRESGPMSLLFSESTGGAMARRLLPVVILVPTVAAWLRLQSRPEGPGDVIASITQLTLANVIIATVAVYFASKSLHGEDIKRKSAEDEILRLNLSLQRQTGRLEAANKGLEAFSFSVSHDLRAPLRHINGYVELLRRGLEGKVEKETARHLDVIGEASRRMGALIDDLLAFAKLERAQVRMAPIDMEEMVRDSIRRVEPDAGGRKVAWDVGKMPEVEADRSLLEQVLVNLLSNALKYSSKRPETRVEIGFAPEKSGRGAFYVRDNGVGFDMQYADNLFGVFQRMHKDTEYEGTGIGLANVRSIVNKHGGKVWAEAEPDRGATFFFTLRLRDGSAVAA
jgi:signal transduction histidine kinase